MQMVLDITAFPDVTALSREAKALTINSPIAEAAALNLLASSRKARKVVEARRKTEKASLDRQVKAIQDKYQVPLTVLRQIEASLEEGLLTYRQAKRVEARRLQQDEDEAFRQRVATAEALEDALLPVPLIVPTPPKTMATESGSVTFKKVKTFDIPGVIVEGKPIVEVLPTRADQRTKDLPDDCFTLDLQKVRARVVAGIATPGCVVRERERTVVR